MEKIVHVETHTTEGLYKAFKRAAAINNTTVKDAVHELMELYVVETMGQTAQELQPNVSIADSAEQEQMLLQPNGCNTALADRKGNDYKKR